MFLWEVVQRPENQLLRFAIIGFVSVVGHLGLIRLFLVLGRTERQASSMSFLCIAFVQFAMHLVWTFRVSQGNPPGLIALSFTLFMVGRTIAWRLNEIVFVRVYGLSVMRVFGRFRPYVSQILTSAILIVFTYPYTKYVVVSWLDTT